MPLPAVRLAAYHSGKTIFPAAVLVLRSAQDGLLLIPLLIVEHFNAFSAAKPGSRWSPSFR
jgi:hypothetical protein